MTTTTWVTGYEALLYLDIIRYVSTVNKIDTYVRILRVIYRLNYSEIKRHVGNMAMAANERTPL